MSFKATSHTHTAAVVKRCIGVAKQTKNKLCLYLAYHLKGTTLWWKKTTHPCL